MVGVQWLNGSFVGEVEVREGRDPGDIDVVTYFGSKAPQSQLKSADPEIFDHDKTKRTFSVDGYYVSFSDPALMLYMASYWHGMWSRSKLDSIPVMKGFLAIKLDLNDTDDQAAIQLLDRLDQGGP